MGGTGIADQREVASALRWWLESGVDTAVQESPRNWMERAAPAAPASQPSAEPHPAPILPETLETFQQWLATSPDAPLASKSKPILPAGTEGAEIMVLAEAPTREELAAGAPVGGESALLLKRMLQAIGMADHAYVANLSCFHSPGGRMTPGQLEQCAAAARRHVALAKPKRLLLLGEAPAQSLLGKALPQARGHIHKIEGIRTVATFHPRQLLKRASFKALAWKDLLLLTEEAP